MIKRILKKIIYGHKSDSASFVKYLREKGAKVGKNTYFFNPSKTNVDSNNAIFLSIGDNCKITQGVTILCHDYSYSVLRPIYHDIPKKSAVTNIGNNVFIGINSIILMGAQIGDNVIIGAGSVVSGIIPSNEVWAGNPAKFICTIDQYHSKCKKNFKKNACLVVKQYNERLGRNPSIQELQYYSLLFLNNDQGEGHYEKMSFNGDDKLEVINDCSNYKSIFKNYNEFIEYAKKEGNKDDN